MYTINETNETDGPLAAKFPFKIVETDKGRVVAWCKDRNDAQFRLSCLDTSASAD